MSIRLISRLLAVGLLLVLTGRETPAQPVSGTERVCRADGGAGYEARIRKTCRVGDIIVVRTLDDAANLCDLRKPSMTADSGNNVCYLAPQREVVSAPSDVAPPPAAPSAMDQEAVKFASSSVLRDRIVVCGTRRFAYTVSFPSAEPVLTELVNPVLVGGSGRNPGTKADALNGIDYVYVVGGLTADASRQWAEGKGWGDWVNGRGGNFPFLSVTHRNGKWDGTLGTGWNAWKESKLDCAAIHQMEESVGKAAEQVMLDQAGRVQETRQGA